MITIKKLVSILAVSLFALFAQDASAQKIAVIDSREVLAKLPEAIAANQRIQTLQKAYTDSIQIMQTAYQTKLETYQKVFDTMNQDAKQKAEEDLKSLQDNFMKFREAKFGQEGELAREQQNLLKPIVDKTTQAIEAVAKRDKYTIVMDKANGTVVFADAAVDISNKVVDYMKSGK